MDLGRGETLINTDLNKIVNEHWDKLAFFFSPVRGEVSSGSRKTKVSQFIFYNLKKPAWESDTIVALSTVEAGGSKV